MANKIIELGKKLLAIATNGGSEGEKETAARMLEEFMAKHQISLADIEGEEKKRRQFYTPKARHKLFFQLVAHVTGGKWGQDCYAVNGRASYTYVKLTDAHFAELQLKYDFYWELYEKQFEIFNIAFIHKNKLFRWIPDDEEEPELTEEEERKAREVALMMQGIKADSPVKRIDKH